MLRIAITSVLLGAAPLSAADRIDFNRDVRPILSEYCYACHGPDSANRKAGLRLDRKESAFAEARSGEVPFVSGKPEESEALRRCLSSDPKKVMPPPKFGKSPTPAQIATLRKWIEQGAEWQPHWAYRPPTRPALPAVQQKSWPRNAIDHFILAELERKGLKPNPEADKTTLIRRLAFDLTGLPPTLAQIDEFLNDTRPDAYERLVERFLSSPRYGERMAMHWLDLARYADTNGYHIDNHRDMWLWREWVINSFNRNQPFDEFTIEQLAGDLLPNPTLSQKIATGFNRNTMVNFEGGADPNEYLTKYIVDRVVTTSTVWLGTTMACAECHDHKYDPFTMRDFYRLYAMFNGVPELGLDGRKENPVPSLKIISPEQQAKLDQIRKQINALDIKANTIAASLKLPDFPAASSEVAKDYIWVDDTLPAGARAAGHEGAASWQWVTDLGHPIHQGQRATVRTATGLSQHYFEQATAKLRIGAGDKLFAHVWLDPRNPPKTIALQWNDGSWEHRAYWGQELPEWGQRGTASKREIGPLPKLGEWVRLEVDASAVGLKPGAQVNGLAFTQVGGTVYYDTAGIHTKTPQGEPNSPTEWEQLAKLDNYANLPPNIQAALKAPVNKRKPNQVKELQEYFVRHIWQDSRSHFTAINTELAELRKAERKIQESITSTMVMEEMAKPRDTFILLRGDWQVKGEKVTAGTPESLPPLPPGQPANRLGLARWLVMPEHPLTARVTINRYWEQVFGIGIVKSSEDFGSQGDWPSHPELLDYLASEFVRTKWDVKAMMRLLVTSATYRQSARVSPELVRLDPYNRLLARGPRFRLPAEMIRDHALSVSGLLDPRIGGPSVRPYQPAGLWEAVSFGGKEYSSQRYEQSKGQDLYRRGMYVYWKRSMPHPSLTTFDAPNREVCTDRRPRTNTPLQALVLMNDPIYVEASRGLAVRALREGGNTDEDRLSYAFRLLTARKPEPREIGVLKSLLTKQIAKFGNDESSARKLVSIGESPLPKEVDVKTLAAWTAICNAMLNLDETITK